jgi:nucleoside diphosphate kinase
VLCVVEDQKETEKLWQYHHQKPFRTSVKEWLESSFVVVDVVVVVVVVEQ